MFFPFFPFFCTIFLAFIVHRSRLPGCDALGAFRQEEDLHRCKDNFEILRNARMGDIHEVHEQFVPGSGIVFSVDLGVAGEAGLGLEAEAELREFLFVLGGNLGALGTGADDAHFPLEDVYELGKLVYADCADEVADRGNAVIVFAGRETGDTVLLCVHAHAAEFEYIEFSPVLGQALLAVESGSAVTADQKGDDDHQGRENDQGDPGAENVEDTLEDQKFRGWVIAFKHQHGQMEHMHRMGALHEEVTDTGNHIDTDAAGDALFDDLVSLMAVDAAEKDGAGLREAGIGVFKDLPYIGRVNHIEALAQAVGFDQFLQAFAHVPDDDSRDGLVSGEIDLMGSPAPDYGQNPACDHRT